MDMGKMLMKAMGGIGGQIPVDSSKGLGIPLSQVFRDYAVESIKVLSRYPIQDLVVIGEDSPLIKDIGFQLIRYALEMREKMLENIR